MKIGIFTQPLHNNYGGLLQCYALMTVLKRMGHQPEVISRVHYFLKGNFFYRFYSNLRHIASCLVHCKYIGRISLSQRKRIAINTTQFIEKYINPCTPFIYSDKELYAAVKLGKYDAFIAGSDQCWRPRYSPCITNYFFDFADKIPLKCKKLAYAASFGVDSWEFNEEETKLCSVLAKKFDAISVREISGINLCKQYLGVNAVSVLDPTMLLEKQDYESIVRAENEPQNPGNLFCYMLDDSPEKSVVLQNIVSKYGLTPFKVMPKYPFTVYNAKHHLDDCIYPRVSQWIRAFMDAELVITDSFHGCVFSIIFNKPFWVVGNLKRGNTRFDTLLSIYGLQNRMITLKELLNQDLKKPIDWDKINRKRKMLQQQSLEFLINNLKSN